MITPEYLEYAVNRISFLYEDLQDRIIEDVTARLLATDFDIADTAKWRIEKLQQSGMVFDDVLSRLSETTGKSNAELKRIFEDAGVEVFNYGDEVYKKLGMKSLSIKQAPAMLKVLKAGLKTTSGTMYNLVNTTALVTENEFIDACDLAHTMITSGAYSYNEAIVSAVERAGKAGAYVYYPTGHRDRVDVASRRAVLSGLGKTVGKLNEMACDELDCDLVEVTAHFNARPSHADWQGLVYSRSGKNKNYPNFAICGYGTGEGLLGWNCYHDFHPFFEGISERAYSDLELSEMKNSRVTYNGYEMSGYEATQVQRGIERSIRESKRKLIAFNKGKANAGSNELAAAFSQQYDKEALKLSKLNAKLHDFVEQTGFQKQYDRSRVIGFGRGEAQRAVHGRKKELQKQLEHDIIKEIKACGIQGAISINPVSIDLSEYTFDDIHINKDRKHGVTRDEAESYMHNAKFLATRWNGRFKNYYSVSGAVYIDADNKNIRTAFSAEEFSQEIIDALEVLKKYGK